MRCLSLWIASRNAISKKNNGFVTFTTFIVAFGLVLGVAALIVVLSVMNGFEQAMKDKILGVVPHIQVNTPYIVKDWQPLATQIQHQNASIRFVAPMLNTQAMISSSKQSYVLSLNGIVPEYEKQWSFLAQPAQSTEQGMIKGDLNQLNQPHSIIIGETLAKELGVDVGDDLSVILPKSADNAAGINPIVANMTVVGIFRLSHQTERYLAFASIDSVAQALSVSVGIQGFKLGLSDVFSAPMVANQLKAYYPELSVAHWMQTHGTIYETLQLQRNLSGLLLLLIILVATFNLVSSLVMTVTDKQADIAILKTMGATPRFIKWVFVWQGLMISTAGTVIGAVIGLLITSNIGWLSSWVNHTFELDLFDNYFVTELPSNIYASDVLLIVVISIAIGVLATLYPAHQAAKIAPAQALRYE